MAARHSTKTVRLDGKRNNPPDIDHIHGPSMRQFKGIGNSKGSEIEPAFFR
jgi:hypothetical protein